MSVLVSCLTNGHILCWTHDLKGQWVCSLQNFWQWLMTFPNKLVVPVLVAWIIHSTETPKENQLQGGSNLNVIFRSNMQDQTTSAFKDCFSGWRVSGDNSSSTERIWSFRGQSSLQTQKAVDLKKHCFHSQLPFWFFFRC